MTRLIVFLGLTSLVGSCGLLLAVALYGLEGLAEVAVEANLARQEQLRRDAAELAVQAECREGMGWNLACIERGRAREGKA